MPNEQLTKQKLLSLLLSFVDDRISSAKEAIQMAQQSANEEGKSSAGDKYETGRAMAQLEIEKVGGQLAEANKMKQVLGHLPINAMSSIVQLGSLVYTDQGNYFLAIPAGKMDVDGITYYVISPASPIGAKLMGLGAGDEFQMKQKVARVQNVR